MTIEIESDEVFVQASGSDECEIVLRVSRAFL